MTYRTMLDTNIVSHAIRNPLGLIAARIAEHEPSGLCLSVVVAAELRFGLQKRGSERLRLRVEAFLGSSNVVPLEPPTDDRYAKLRAALEAAGTPIGPWIAAHALALGVTLITHNLAEFRRVPGLSVESWLE